MKKSTLFFISIIMIIVLNIINFPTELRFQYPALNYLFVIILFILLPISVFIKVFSSKKKILGFIGALVVLFFSSIVIFFASLNFLDIIKNGIDPSFEMIKEVSKDDKYYRLYRTNGGATTSYGLVLREEKDLLFGLKFVSVMFDKYKAYDATLEFISPNKLKIEVQPYSNRQEVDKRIFEL